MVERDGSNTAPSDVDVVVVGAGFSGLYLLAPSPAARLLDQGVRRGRRRGGDLVLEPVPRRPLRHPDHRLLLQLRPGARARLDLVGEVRHPAGDPGLPAASSPTATTCAATSSFRRGSSRRSGTSRRARWRLRTDRGDEISCRFYVMASGCLSLPKSPDIAGADRFGGEVYFTSTLAPRGRRLHRQAGGGDRHRLLGHPVDPADRRRRPPSSRSSSAPPNFSIPAHNGPACG